MASMIRVSLSLVALAFILSCGPTMPPKCQPSNCSGCCTEAGECLGVMKQNRTTCGSGGIACLVCANGQTCSAQGRCVADTTGTGGGSASAGGTAGTGGGGSAICGGEGEVCCANQMCSSSFSCSRGLCIRCGQTNQPCCSGNCLGSNICTNGTCVFPSGTGGGSATGGGVATGGGLATGGGNATGGGLATGGGTVTAGGSATGGGVATGGGTASAGGTASGGGTALLAIGDPCMLSTECADGLCLTALFDNGYCSKTCTSDSDCAFGSNCSRNPAGGPNVCLKRCSTAGTTTGCRPSYVCDKAGTSLLGVPVCFPACTSPSSCGAGANQCDGRGFCCGAAPYACCNNTTCDSGYTCTAGYCTGSGAGGGSSGTGGGSSGTGGGSSGTGGGSSGTGGGTTSGGAVGATCTGQSGCSGDPVNKRCNPTWTGVPPWTGGYCTIGNCTTTGPAACPSGSSCALYSGSPNHCLANCDFATQTGCRTGYVCERGITADFYQGSCYPKCTTNSHCGGTGRCDTATGSCCGNIGYKCCSTGTACSQGTCRANLGGYCG